MGKSIRSKRMLMLRAAKAAALHPVQQKRIEELYNKLQHSIAIQDGTAEPQKNLNVPSDNVVVQNNFVDFRAENTMSSGQLLKEGNRLPFQFHSHPAMDDQIEERKPMHYRPEQFSYFTSPAEAKNQATNTKSSKDIQNKPATITPELQLIIAAQSPEDLIHVKDSKVTSRVRVDHADAMDEGLAHAVGNTRYLNRKPKDPADKAAYDISKRLTKRDSKRVKRIKRLSDKKDLFKRVGKTSGRGKM